MAQFELWSYVKIFQLDFKYSFPVSLGHDPKPYNKQLSELRYSGIKTEGAPSLLEVIRYIGRNLLSWFLISKEGP